MGPGRGGGGISYGTGGYSIPGGHIKKLIAFYMHRTYGVVDLD